MFAEHPSAAGGMFVAERASAAGGTFAERASAAEVEPQTFPVRQSLVVYFSKFPPSSIDSIKAYRKS